MPSVISRRRPGGGLLIVLAVGLLVASNAQAVGSASPKASKAGYFTPLSSMVTVLGGGSAKAIISVGETVNGYRFESLPDGISVLGRGNGAAELYLNNETSRVPFPLAGTGAAWSPTNNGNGTQNDFDNAQLAQIRIHQTSAGFLDGSYVIPTGANYQRFCSNFLATEAEGFSRPILFTNEEATDFVNRTGDAYPAVTTEPPSEQAGVAVAYDVKGGTYRTLHGLGRMNHENSVAIPGYDDLVLLTGDDTFSAPSSQVYSYIAPDTDAVWNDTGHLYAFKSNNANVNDYGDITGAGWVAGTFIQVPDNIADGPQGPLETWSNNNNVFQFIRIEDIAYDRNTPNVVYMADTGEPRALQDASGGGTGPNRLLRGPSGTMGPYPNGRVWKMTLNATDPLVVDRLEILVDTDSAGPGVSTVMHQPDNLETTENSVLVTEDPGSHNQGSPAKIWRYDLDDDTFTVVATVDQSLDGTAYDIDGFANGALGSWEATGIVDVSQFYGPGSFLVNVQAHTIWVEKLAADDNLTRSGSGFTAGPDTYPDWMNKREGGQLLLITIPGA